MKAFNRPTSTVKNQCIPVVCATRWQKACLGNCSASRAVILVCHGWPLSSLLKPEHIRLLRRRPTHVGVWLLIICLNFKGLSRQLKICGQDPPSYCNVRTTRSPHMKLRLCWMSQPKYFHPWGCGLCDVWNQRKISFVIVVFHHTMVSIR